MALTQPILYSKNAFDATEQTTFTFEVIGGSQVVGNILSIKNSATLQTVYSTQQTTFKFEQVLPANTLTNGTYYTATITTIDANGNQSAASQPVQFWCYTQPTFQFTNVTNNGIITNSNYNFEVQYNQAENEQLNVYVFNLYSISGSLIATSKNRYNTAIPPNIINYLFSGFANETQYSIECNGVTSEGTEITTGRIVFIVQYKKPSVYSFLNIINNCNGGYISIESNIIGIIGKSNPYPPSYIDNKEVDLSAEGSSVYWDEGYEILDDFTASIWGRNFKSGEDILRFSNADGDTIVVRYWVGEYGDETTQSAWVSLDIVTITDDWQYSIASNRLTNIPTDTTNLAIYIRKIDGLYDITISDELA